MRPLHACLLALPALALALASACSSPPPPMPPLAAEPDVADKDLDVDAGVIPPDAAVVAEAASDAAPVAAASPRIVPCVDGSAAHRDAIARMTILKRTIAALKVTDDHAAAATLLSELIAHPCLAVARHLGNIPQGKPAGAPSLLEFWENGGEVWLRTEISRKQYDDHVLPPSYRSMLSREAVAASGKKHPLEKLLCSVKDASCAAASNGWAHRVEGELEIEHDEDAVTKATDACTAEALALPATERYEHWHSCLESSRQRRQALPLWLPPAPTKGWLIVRGRRGHYQFCDEVRLFNLASGAATSIQSCSGLVLQGGGSVDQGATDAARGRRFRRGTVNVENLRETVWMLLMVPQVEEVTDVAYRRLPEGIEVAVADSDGGIMGSMTGSFMSSSAQTTLHWRLVGSEIPEIAGTMRWPSDYNSRAASHAVDLLRVAEAGFVDGCPKMTLPRLAKSPGRSGVSGLDADPARLALLQSDLLADLRKRSASRCRRQKPAR